jgi:hypothetical protein
MQCRTRTHRLAQHIFLSTRIFHIRGDEEEDEAFLSEFEGTMQSRLQLWENGSQRPPQTLLSHVGNGDFMTAAMRAATTPTVQKKKPPAGHSGTERDRGATHRSV